MLHDVFKYKWSPSTLAFAILLAILLPGCSHDGNSGHLAIFAGDGGTATATMADCDYYGVKVSSWEEGDIRDGTFKNCHFWRLKGTGYAGQDLYIVCGGLGTGGLTPPSGANPVPVDAVLEPSFRDNPDPACGRHIRLNAGFAIGELTRTSGDHECPPSLPVEPAKHIDALPTPWRHVVTQHVAAGAYVSRYVFFTAPPSYAKPGGFPVERLYWREGCVWGRPKGPSAVDRLLTSAKVTELNATPGTGDIPSRSLLTDPAAYGVDGTAFCDAAEAFLGAVRAQLSEPAPRP